MKYNAFISYRKTSSVNADWIRQSIAGNSEYSLEDIFLDKHSIGPELFDEKIKKAISESNCVVLLVTKDCFRAKEDAGEDWFIKEVKTALTLGKRVIPVLFDNISSLSDSSIADEIKKNFTSEEIAILVKSQCIPYSNDFPDASISKLIHFIEEANKTSNIWAKALRYIKGLMIVIAILIVFFALFFGFGVLWGYFSSSTDSDSVLVDNTIIDGNTMRFEYEGWNATYDLSKDTIFIDIKEFVPKPRIGNAELILSSFTFTGAKIILEKNLSYLKYVKFLKGGSKPAKITFACASVAACAGAFCGFSQGSSFGRSKRQEETALMLYPKLQQRSTWQPLMKGNISLSRQYLWWQLVKAPNCIAIGTPFDSNCVAYKAGMQNAKVLLKYNSWEIGNDDYLKLMSEIEASKKSEKLLLFLNMEDLNVSEYHLPEGVVGITFQPGDGNQGRYDLAVEKFKEWLQRH